MGQPSAVTQFLRAVRLGDEPVGPGGVDAPSADTLLPLIGYEQVGAWTWHRLRQGRALGATAPGFQQELRKLGLTQAAINLRIGAVTARVVALLASQGIRPVLLKGVACCALAERYPFFQYRQTGDADLLIEPGREQRAWQLLIENGFRLASAEPGVHPDHHHLPTLVSDAQVAVEIHASASFFWSPNDSWTRFGASAREISWQGQQVLVPAPTEMLWHGVVHSLGDGAAGCRLRNFLTAAAVIAEGHDVDWDLVADRTATEQICDHDSRQRLPAKATRHWLATAAWLAGRELPRRLGVGFDPESDLVRLLDFRRRRLEAWPRSARSRRLTTRWLDEAARAQLDLGLGRLGHWQPARQRPRRVASSLVLRLMYLAARGPARTRHHRLSE